MFKRLYNIRFVLIILALFFSEGVFAHGERAERDSLKVKKVRKEKKRKLQIDTLSLNKDSLTISTAKGTDKVRLLVDSLRKSGVVVDSATIDSLARRYFSDTLKVKGGVLPRLNADGSLSNARILDSLLFAERLLQNKEDNKKERVNIFKDSISFGKMSTTAIVLPGFAQIYNKQYWKLPVLYGSVAAFAYGGVMMGNKAKNAQNDFNMAIENGNQAATDKHYGRYRDYKTVSTVLYVGAVATYMYFLADGAFNYKGGEDDKNRATYLAFMFPGAGQIYNKQYWKLPIVYGGFATMAYIINFNGRGYTRYKRAYDAVSQGKPDEFNKKYSEDILRNTKNNFRRARDMAIFYTAGFYLLTVVDAYVSASFKQYDISDDLSIQVAPKIDYNNYGTNSRNFSGGSYGMSMRFTF